MIDFWSRAAQHYVTGPEMESLTAVLRTIDVAEMASQTLLLSFDNPLLAQARAINPRIEIVARAHFDAEVEHLLQHGANTVVMGEREIARAMLELARTNPAVDAT